MSSGLSPLSCGGPGPPDRSTPQSRAPLSMYFASVSPVAARNRERPSEVGWTKSSPIWPAPDNRARPVRGERAQAAALGCGPRARVFGGGGGAPDRFERPSEAIARRRDPSSRVNPRNEIHFPQRLAERPAPRDASAVSLAGEHRLRWTGIPKVQPSPVSTRFVMRRAAAFAMPGSRATPGASRPVRRSTPRRRLGLRLPVRHPAGVSSNTGAPPRSVAFAATRVAITRRCPLSIAACAS